MEGDPLTPNELEQLAASRRDIFRGDVLTAGELEELMKKRRAGGDGNQRDR